MVNLIAAENGHVVVCGPRSKSDSFVVAALGSTSVSPSCGDVADDSTAASEGPRPRRSVRRRRLLKLALRRLANSVAKLILGRDRPVVRGVNYECEGGPGAGGPPPPARQASTAFLAGKKTSSFFLKKLVKHDVSLPLYIPTHHHDFNY